MPKYFFLFFVSTTLSQTFTNVNNSHAHAELLFIMNEYVRAKFVDVSTNQTDLQYNTDRREYNN